MFLILNFLGMLLFIVALFAIGFALNKGMDWVATKRGWYTEPLTKHRWYHKYLDRVNAWYLKNLDLINKGQL